MRGDLEALDADALVEQLRDIPSAVPAGVPSNGIERPAEVLRRQICNRLLVQSPATVHALARGLQDPDVEFRRNVALLSAFLAAVGGPLAVELKGWISPQFCPSLSVH